MLLLSNRRPGLSGSQLALFGGKKSFGFNPTTRMTDNTRIVNAINHPTGILLRNDDFKLIHIMPTIRLSQLQHTIAMMMTGKINFNAYAAKRQ